MSIKSEPFPVSLMITCTAFIYSPSVLYNKSMLLLKPDYKLYDFKEVAARSEEVAAWKEINIKSNMKSEFWFNKDKDESYEQNISQKSDIVYDLSSNPSEPDETEQVSDDTAIVTNVRTLHLVKNSRKSKVETEEKYVETSKGSKQTMCEFLYSVFKCSALMEKSQNCNNILNGLYENIRTIVLRTHGISDFKPVHEKEIHISPIRVEPKVSAATTVRNRFGSSFRRCSSDSIHSETLAGQNCGDKDWDCKRKNDRQMYCNCKDKIKEDKHRANKTNKMDPVPDSANRSPSYDNTDDSVCKHSFLKNRGDEYYTKESVRKYDYYSETTDSANKFCNCSNNSIATLSTSTCSSCCRKNYRVNIMYSKYKTRIKRLSRKNVLGNVSSYFHNSAHLNIPKLVKKMKNPIFPIHFHNPDNKPSFNKWMMKKHQTAKSSNNNKNKDNVTKKATVAFQADEKILSKKKLQNHVFKN